MPQDPHSVAEPDPMQPTEMREHRYDPRDLPDKTLGPKVWVESPGSVLLPTVPKRLLCECYNYLNSDQVKYVTCARAVIRAGKLYLIPMHKDDPESAKVAWSRGNARISLSRLFAEAQVAIEHGFKELCPCSFEKQTPYGPAVVIDLAHSEEKKEKKQHKNHKK